MTVELFLSLLVISAAATSIGIQIAKNVMDKLNITYKTVPIAVISSVLIGIAEVFIYYGVNNIPFTIMTIIYAICMGIANAIGSTTDYDLVKKFILALWGKQEG